MQKFLDQLNDNLIYINDSLDDKTITIECTVDKLDCYIRGYKTRTLKDLNFGDKFVILKIKLPIYYLDEKKEKSFVHSLTCCDFRARNTKRLENLIITNIKESSSIGFERTMKETICHLSDSSILRILKKTMYNYQL